MKAKVQSVVIVPAVEEVREERVVLELTREEALYLSAYTGNIAGRSDLRKTMSRIYQALKDAGIQGKAINLKVDAPDTVTMVPYRPLTGRLY